MRISTLCISVLSLVACVTAASFQPFLARRVPAVSVASFGRGLERRQISVPPEPSVPSQCTSTCNPVNDEIISLGCPVTSCCTTTFETQYYNCLECVGIALNAANYSSAQTNLNLLYTTCVDIGYVLSPMALPGQVASGSSSSAGAPPATTGSGAPFASATALSSTKSSGAVPSSPSTAATGSAISGRWHGVRAEALIGTAVLLGVAGLW